MTQDRITELWVRNLRCLADVRLHLTPTTIGIGGNGSGKSSLVEACALIRKIASDSFISEVYQAHMGAAGLFRRGASSLILGVRLEGAGNPLDYEIEIRDQGNALAIVREEVLIDNGKAKTKFRALQRQGENARVFDVKTGQIEQFAVADDRSVVAGFGGRTHQQPAIPRLAKALGQIEVHPTFMTHPRWMARALRFEVPMRDASLLQPADRLTFGGGNLANAFFALRNDKSDQHWRTTMDYVRLGLGPDVESVNTRPDPGGGHLALTLKRVGVDQQEPASALSEGMLSYLAFIAILRLEAPTSLLVFDEPETHLHPRLLHRVLDFIDDISERATVLLFTHSDRLLDAVDDAAAKVVLLELTVDRATVIQRPDPKQLDEWLAVFEGIGDARAAGHQGSIFKESKN